MYPRKTGTPVASSTRSAGDASGAIDAGHVERSRHFTSGPAHWLMRKITNSAGRTTATPISVTTWPSSRCSGGFVSASHLT